MSTHDEAWPEGTPAWVDLTTDDPAAAAQFYRQLFGWQIQQGPPEFGGYQMALLADRTVAGIAPKPPGMDVPTAWSTYLAVDDVDDTLSRVTAAGGQVLMPALDVMQEGRMAVAADPTGAVFGMWQAGNHYGAQRVNEPGALTWNECMTRDYQRALDFYSQVFGYTYDDVGDGQGFQYSVFKVNGRVAGGIGELGANMPGEIPPHWMAYFAVSSTDDLVSGATDAGGQAAMPATDTPFGRMAVLRGPQGETFAVIESTAASSPAVD